MNQRTSRLVTRIARFAAMSVVVTGLIGLAHRPEVRPAMRWLGGALGLTQRCPFGYDVVASPEEVARARRDFSASHAGTAPAPTRQVLGLELGQSTRGDVEAWSAGSGSRCTAGRDPSHLTCTPSRAGEDLLESTVWLEFDEHDVLSRLTTVRKAERVAVINGAFAQVIATLGTAPVHRDGEATEAFLAGGSLRQASAEYRFSNYFALVRATNLGAAYLLTEDYRAL